MRQQEDTAIDTAGLGKASRKLLPWKAAGLQRVQGYWVKNFTSLHRRIATQLGDIMNKGKPQVWMTTGGMVLVPKNPRTNYMFTNNIKIIRKHLQTPNEEEHDTTGAERLFKENQRNKISIGL